MSDISPSPWTALVEITCGMLNIWKFHLKVAFESEFESYIWKLNLKVAFESCIWKFHFKDCFPENDTYFSLMLQTTHTHNYPSAPKILKAVCFWWVCFRQFRCFANKLLLLILGASNYRSKQIQSRRNGQCAWPTYATVVHVNTGRSNKMREVRKFSIK